MHSKLEKKSAELDLFWDGILFPMLTFTSKCIDPKMFAHMLFVIFTFQLTAYQAYDAIVL